MFVGPPYCLPFNLEGSVVLKVDMTFIPMMTDKQQKEMHQSKAAKLKTVQDNIVHVKKTPYVDLSKQPSSSRSIDIFSLQDNDVVPYCTPFTKPETAATGKRNKHKTTKKVSAKTR